MAINEWWAGQAHQRFWMEATDRNDLGDALRAPIGGSEGQSVWNYDLVAHTHPGDIVFHWHTTLFKSPGLVGWSEVLGPLQEEQHMWKPKAGPASKGQGTLQMHWVMPLGGLHLLDRPILISDIRTLRDQILGLRVELEGTITGPSYYPFNKYDSPGSVPNIRAMQGYFTKFPAELVELLSQHYDLELDALATAASSLADNEVPSLSGGSSQGFINDTERRLAVEKHAVDRAVKMYEELGATDIVIVGKPYDIRMNLHGEEVRVEVKGSTNQADHVLVTRNEVSHANEYPWVELVVVDRVDWVRDAEGTLTVSGGRLRRWAEWKPTAASLHPRTYDHELGDGWVTVLKPSAD
jgi:hypothetical protein